MKWLLDFVAWLTADRGRESMVGAVDAWEAFGHALSDRTKSLEQRLDKTEEELRECKQECQECHRERDLEKVERLQLERRVEELEKQT